MNSNPKLNVLTHVLEDDIDVIAMLEKLFKLNGLNDSRFFVDAEEFISEMHENVHIAVIDYYLRGPLNGLEVMKIILSQNPLCKVIMISGQHDMNVVIDFCNSGGFRYVDKNDTKYSDYLVSYMQEAIELVKRQIDLYNEVRQLNDGKD